MRQGNVVYRLISMSVTVLHAQHSQNDRAISLRHPANLLISIRTPAILPISIIQIGVPLLENFYPQRQCARFFRLGRLQHRKLIYPAPSYASMKSCKGPRRKYHVIIIKVKGDLVSTHAGLARANFPTITPS